MSVSFTPEITFTSMIPLQSKMWACVDDCETNALILKELKGHSVEEWHIRETHSFPSSPSLCLLPHDLPLRLQQLQKTLLTSFRWKRKFLSLGSVFSNNAPLCFSSVKDERERERDREGEASLQVDIFIVDLLASTVRSESGVIQEAFVVREDGGSSRIHSGSSGKLHNAQEKQTSLKQLAEHMWVHWRQIRNTQLLT